jgi:hypothetical protein
MSREPRSILTVLAIMLAVLSCAGIACAKERVVIVGKVIAVEAPEFPWPMETESVKIIYVRVERVEKGVFAGRYARIVYPYNPSSNPQSKLPEVMFDGKSLWRFQLTLRDHDAAMVIASRKDGDWLEEEKAAPAGKELLEVPIVAKAVATPGFKDETLLLERRGSITGFWLGPFERIRQ